MSVAPPAYGRTVKTRATRSPLHRCTECGCETPRWLGRCPSCDTWGSIVEQVRSGLVVGAGEGPVPLCEVSTETALARSTGVAELDRVLGGGLVPGSVTLLAGEPGMGKSTLLLQALARMAEAGARCLLVTAEESTAQVRMRAERLGALAATLLVVSDTSLPDVLTHVESVEPDVLALDSIQTVLDPGVSGAPGSVTQVRDSAYRLVQQAKERALATVLVGHVTKEGTLAGPRVLEHVVDTVLSFEGDRGQSLRMLHALKHRFGGTSELGLFEMTPCGLVDVPDASTRFLLDRRTDAPGSAVATVLEGTRPMLVEIQSLVVTGGAPPRRYAAGLDPARLAMLLAVLSQHAAIDTAQSEVYASVAGGLRVTETGADLALALAVGSAQRRCAVDARTAAVGELGLGGEVRTVPQLDRRIEEAARLGFTRVLAPPAASSRPGIEVVPVHDVTEALARCLG
jgi:DNA repair protein RadA/Sms